MNELQDKAIDIKGRKYILVSDRVLAFNEAFPQGSITTELVSEPTADMVVMKAIVKPKFDEERVFTGYSQATWGDGMVNKTAALENCETSAVGRALGFMGIGVIDSIASVDEVNKAMTQPAPSFKKEALDGMQQQLLAQPCKKCGAPQLWSDKSGRPYCSKKCWLKQQNDYGASSYDSYEEMKAKNG